MCRGGLRLPGLRSGTLPGGGIPPGAKTISFSAEKETVLDSKEKMGPVYGRSGVKNGGLRLSYDSGDPSRPLRPSLVKQGQACALFTRRLRVPLSGPGWSGASLQRRGRLDRARRPRRTAALCRESGTARRPQDRTKSPSLFHYGMAVTAGAGPQTVRKDVSRRFPSTNAP